MVRTPRPTWSGIPENAIAYDGHIDVIGSPSTIATAIARLAATGPVKEKAGLWPA